MTNDENDEFDITKIIVAVVITILIIITIITVHNITNHATQQPNTTSILNAFLPSNFNTMMDTANQYGGSFNLFGV